MSDITPSQSIGPVPAVEPERDKPSDSARQKEKNESEHPEKDQGIEEHRVEDIAVILGVPASDVTPQIQKGLTNIMNEYDRQRHELDSLLKRVSFLEKQCDTHPFLPIMSRHALEGAINKVLNRADQAHTENSFVCFQLEGLEKIRRVEGLSLVDLIISNTANMIAAELRASDIFGSMGGYGLGVVFTVTNYEGAEATVQQLVPAIERKLQASHTDLRLFFGIYPFKPHDTTAHIFATADADLRRRFG